MIPRHRRSDDSALAGVPLFDGYAPRQIAPLAPHVDRLVVAPGARLARAGRSPHEVLVILTGEAVVRRAGVEVAPLGPGAAVGAVEETTGSAHEHDVVAATAVSALVIEGRAFRWAAQTLPGFIDRLAAQGRSRPSRPPARAEAGLGSAA